MNPGHREADREPDGPSTHQTAADPTSGTAPIGALQDEMDHLDEKVPAGSNWAQLAFGTGILAVGVLLLQQGLQVPGTLDPAGPRFLPVLIGAGWLLLAAAYVAGTVLALVRRRDADSAEAFHHLPQVLLLLVVLVAYAYLIDPLGYLLTTSVFFAVCAAILGSRSQVRDAVVAVGLTVAIYFAFSRGLGIYLPPGVIPL